MPEKLAHIPMPADANHYIMMPLAEYREREAFHEEFEQVIEDIDRAIARGRLEGRLAGYRVVLSHIQSPLSPIRTPESVASLERLIDACQADLDKLVPMTVREELAYQLTAKAIRHMDLKCPLEPGHGGPCMGEQVVGQAVGGPDQAAAPAPAGG